MPCWTPLKPVLSLSLSSPAPWMPPCGQSGAPSMSKTHGSCIYVLNSKAAHNRSTCDDSLHQRRTKSLKLERHTSAVKHVGKKGQNSAGTWYLLIFRFGRYMGEKSDDITRRWNFDFKLHYIMRGRPQDYQHCSKLNPDEGDVTMFTSASGGSFPVSRQWSTKNNFEDMLISAAIDAKVVRNSIATNKCQTMVTDGHGQHPKS